MDISKVGAQMFSMREHMKTPKDVKTTMKRISEIGYQNVQISGTSVDPEIIAAAAKDSGLRIVATHESWPAFKDDLDGIIAKMRLYECNHPAVGALPGEYRTVDGIARFVKELAPIAAKLADNGMDFSYHNHDFEFVKSGDKTILELMYDSASPNILKAELDVHWVQAGGADPIEWIRKCAGRQPLLHLKDFVVNEERERMFAAIGEGNMNMKGIIAAALESGVEWFLVEQDNFYGADGFEVMATSLNNLKEL